MVPFPTTRIFLGDGTKFVLDAELSEAVDKAQANESISTIMEFINNRTQRRGSEGFPEEIRGSRKGRGEEGGLPDDRISEESGSAG